MEAGVATDKPQGGQFAGPVLVAGSASGLNCCCSPPDPAALLDMLLDREPFPRLGRHVEPGGERAAHRAGGVDDHLGGHDVVGLRGIKRVALGVLDDVDVLVGLGAGRDRVHDLLLVVGIDVTVDHDHVLDKVDLAERDEGGLLACSRKSAGCTRLAYRLRPGIRGARVAMEPNGNAAYRHS
jgi:hypothetical protein